MTAQANLTYPSPDDIGDQTVFWEPSLAFLKIAIACMLAGSVVYEIALFIVAPDQTARAVVVLMIAFVALVAAMLLRLGRARATVWTLCVGAWLYITLTSFFFGGVNSTGVILYPLTILVVGWLIGARAAIVVTALTLVATLGFVLGDTLGWVKPPPATAPVLRWIVQSIVFVLSAVVIVHVARSYRGRIDEVRRLGSELERRSAELLAREADLNRAQAVAKTGSWVCDVVADKIQLSDESCRILGIPLGTGGSYATYMSRVHAEDQSAVDAGWQAVLRGEGPYEMEHRLMVAHKVREVGLRAALETAADGTALRVVGTIQDITERKLVEAALQLTRMGVDTTSDALFWMAPDGRFVDVNPAACRSLSYTREELLCRGVPDIDPDYVAEKWQLHFAELRQRGSLRFETAHLASDGRRFPVEIACSYLEVGGEERCCAFVRDISERKQHEADMLAARRQLEATLDAIPDLLFEVGLDGRYYSYHSPSTELLAAPPEQLIGNTVSDVMPAAAADVCLAALRDAHETGHSHGRQFKLELPHGMVWFELSVSRKPVEPGAEPRFIVLSRDISKRKSAEEALRASEMQLQCILGATADGILAVDNAGNVIQTNRRFAELWRIPQKLVNSGNDKALLEHVVSQLTEPAAFIEKVERLYHSNATSADTIGFKDGRVFDRYTAPLVLNGAVEGRVWSFRDITAQVQTAGALRLQEERLRLAMEASRQGWFDVNVQSGEVSVSPDYARILGHDPAEVRTSLQNWLEGIHPSDQGVMRKAFAECLASGEARQMEYRRQTSSGDWKWILSIGKVVEWDAGGKPLRMIGTHADISERRQADDALRIRDIALQHSLDAVAMADMNNRITYVNYAFLALWGYDSAQRVVGQTVDMFWKLAGATQAVVESIRKTGGWRGEMLALRADGTTFDAEVAASLATSADGQPIAMMASFVDISERKRAERNLNLAVEVTQVVLWEVDLVTGRIVFDHSMGRLLGLDEDSDMPQSIPAWIERVHADDRAAFQEALAQAMQPANANFDLEYRMTGKAGRIQWIRSRGRAAQRDAEGKPLTAVGTSMNITAAKLAEESLRQSERRFRDLLQSVPSVAVQGYAADGTTQYWNEASERLYGYSAEEAIGKDLLELVVPPEMHDGLRSAMRQMVETGRPAPTAEMSLLRRDGSRVEVLSSHAVVQMPGGQPELFCLDVDLTARMREAALTQLLESLARATNEATTPLSAMITCLERICAYGNWDIGHVVMFAPGQTDGWAPVSIWRCRDEARFAEFTRHADGFVYFRPAGNFIAVATHEQRPVWIEDLASVNSLGRIALARDAGIRSGFVFPLIVSGEVTGFLEFFATETRAPDELLLGSINSVASQLGRLIERNRAEEALARLNADLEMRVAKRTADLEIANRELNSFSYTIAHDMRGPVRAMNGFGEMVLKAGADKLDPVSVGYLKRVVAGSRHMSQLIDDLLNLTRLSRQEMQRRDFDLSEIAAEVVAALGAAHPERKVEVTLQKDMPTNGDPGLIRAVLDNLIGNAWKFTGKTVDARIDIGKEQRDGWTAYYIRDNGSGFDMKFAHKLFEPFQRLHHASEFEGTGIGLATVKKVIQRHGGKIWIESAVNAGTTVYFTIGGANG